jgi:hypothetical protein
MYTEIATALSTVKTMSDLTALILKTKVDSAVTQKAIESQSAIISLQSAMLSLQSQYQELLRQNEELKRQMADMENWSAEAQNYSLTEIAPGVLVYASKLDNDDGSPSHWLCTHCYGKKQRSIPQRGKKNHSGTIYSCPSCKTEILDHTNHLTVSIA